VTSVTGTPPAAAAVIAASVAGPPAATVIDVACAFSSAAGPRST